MRHAKEIQVHVTRVAGSDVYGHSADHCDDSGCNGTERYWPRLRGSVEPGDDGCVRGELVATTDLVDE